VRVACAILVAVSVTAVSATCTAQTAPAPKSAPKVRPPDARKGAATAGNSQKPDPVIPFPRHNFPASINDNQKAQAAKVSAYLSSLQTLVGKFVQRAPDGSKTTGDFYIQKPGKVRFEYDEPSPIDIVADGSSLVVRDRKLATQDVYPLSQTPLRFLPAETVALAFLRSEKRKVDKSGCISFGGKKYEVGVIYIGRTVEVVYDPADKSQLTVEDKHFNTSFRVRELVIGAHTGPRPKLPDFMTPATPETSRLLDEKQKRYDKRQLSAKRAISYAQINKGGDADV